MPTNTTTEINRPAPNTVKPSPLISVPEPSTNDKGAPSRRKIVDRRDPDGQSQAPNNDRRSDSDRRKTSKQLLNHRSGSTSKSDSASKPEAASNEERIQLYRRKLLLAGCEPVMGMNYDCLAMDDYPSNEEILSAKRERDYFLGAGLIASAFFLFGFTGFLPALIAGIAFGIALVAFALAYGGLRKYFFDSRSYRELMDLRRVYEFNALNHIRFLEGKDGLAWRCHKMRKYNNNLERTLFNGMLTFSKQGDLLNVIRNRKQIRLYLLFMIEAQKAYKRLQKDYLERHFENLEQGVDDTLTDSMMNEVETSEEDYIPEPGNF